MFSFVDFWFYGLFWDPIMLLYDLLCKPSMLWKIMKAFSNRCQNKYYYECKNKKYWAFIVEKSFTLELV